MKTFIRFSVLYLFLGSLLVSCGLPVVGGNGDLEGTQVAIAIQQTSLAMQQEQLEQPAPVQEETQIDVLPTYTPYPTYTVQVSDTQVVIQPTATSEPVQVEEPAPVTSFEDWMEDVKILLYDDMYGYGEALVIENALDGLGLGNNTTNVRDAMGNFLSSMNSSTNWDLIIIGAENRDNISGEYFDIISSEMDRGSSFILEVWYIDDISSGRIQPVLQRCGIDFHRDWQRAWNSDPNDYLVYLLEPDDLLFSEPNAISMLIPYDILWTGDVGDMLKINTGSDAVLLGGSQAKEHSAYGLIAECLDGRMIWQTFSTHDYKTQDMINLWQNYIYNALHARYEYLN